MALHQPGVAEHSVDARRTHGDDIGVEHHEGESPVAFQGMGGVVIQDGLLLPGFEPPIARGECIVLIDQSVASPPVVELAGGNAEPVDEPPEGDLSALGPVPHEVDDGVAGVMGNPGPGQSSPSSILA